MNILDTVLENEERAIFNLRNLYKSYGFSKYKMSKFEEYDFYVRNKDFLISDTMITFTDSDGKLMALKPDVTLSIIKNTKDAPGVIKKVYYNENVYRASGDTKDVKEIMQLGLECIGDIDDYSVAETVLLAAMSLESIADEYVLDISHMTIISEALDFAGLTPAGQKAVLCALGEKNMQAIDIICEKEEIDSEKAEILKSLVSFYGIPSEVLPKLKNLSVSEAFSKAVIQLEKIADMLSNSGYEKNDQI